jgi:hypothetical protein
MASRRAECSRLRDRNKYADVIKIDRFAHAQTQLCSTDHSLEERYLEQGRICYSKRPGNLETFVDAGFAAAITPWNKDLAHWELAQYRILLAVPKGHPLTQRRTVRLRDLREMPFIWFQRSSNPPFDDKLTQECARGGLSAPRVVQEATDRDTLLGVVQCGIGIAWLTESMRWHCPAA